MTITPGMFLRRYEVRALLGAGGMGEVYRAYDTELERPVALKVLPSDRGDASSERVQRFIQEAKAASALNHPNVAHVYEIGEHDDHRFIAMELVDGENLRQRIARGPLPLPEAISIAMQIAAALSSAHAAGIIHRDIKPENVVVRPDGYVKVLDFGLAKLLGFRGEDVATVLKTGPNVAVGTMAYMSPEQLEGGNVDARSDLFSLGVLLYEMVTGHRPFEASTLTATMAAILSKTPPPLTSWRLDAPPQLQRVVSKAMAKARDDRYGSADELLEDLREIAIEGRPTSGTAFVWSQHVGRRLSKRVAAVVSVALLVAAGAATAWLVHRNERRQRALDTVTAAELLLQRGRYGEAYDLASTAAFIIPEEPRVRDIITTTSDGLTVESDPPGARLYLQRLSSRNEPQPRQFIAVTPVKDHPVARADYIVTLEKSGYAPATRSLSLSPVMAAGIPWTLRSRRIRVTLLKTHDVPRGMVFVEGGEYQLVGWSRPSDRAVTLNDYFIDQFEVTNREFEEFIRNGGYRRRELWKYPFVLEDGKSISREEAMIRFVDTTGLPAPRKWANAQPPAGRENYPVTDITWYEAAAYAEWRGKKLPTVYQWEKAARDRTGSPAGVIFPWGVVDEGVDVTERANFTGTGPMPVNSLPSGMSVSGAYHMAGNVAEWCLNRMEPGFAVRGGGWNDASYHFGLTGAYPGLHSSATIGFRCVKERPGTSTDQGSFALSTSGFVPEYEPVRDAEFRRFLPRYDYVRGPLQARVVERQEGNAWVREKITFTGAGGKSVIAYLYLPKGYSPPFQVIHYVPGSDVSGGRRSLPASIEHLVGPQIRAGRAAFGVVLEGYIERPSPANFVRPDSRSSEYTDIVVAQVTDLRRGLDYVQTRRDLNASRVGMFAFSAGAGVGVMAAAVETRYRSVVFLGTGLRPSEATDVAAANRIHFAARIAAPKLMLHGRYDESMPLRSHAEPMFRVLPEPKRLVTFEGGHTPPPEISTPVMKKWFDETLGPVTD